MSGSKNESPGIMPLLSAGRHRSPRRGACFMEFASYLAGERWSDHPRCTHAALAFLARMVNDCTSDRHRSELVELIPAVIGLTGEDPRVEVAIAVRAAAEALPIASEERQRALAAGLLCCERVLDEMEPMPALRPAERIRAAFDQVPQAERWARRFLAAYVAAGTERAVSRMMESIIRIGVLGIAQACVSEPDARLRRLLAGAIDDCTVLLGDPAGSAPARPVGARLRVA